jgi:FKBP-type peptidyl-prolyl cis-trans isomerase FkpA
VVGAIAALRAASTGGCTADGAGPHWTRINAMTQTPAFTRTLATLPLALAAIACHVGVGAQPATAASGASPGLGYTSLREGTGPSPTAADTVKVHYRGTLVDGTEFDSSYKRNEPAVFPLGRVIKCWTEGVQKMKVGGKAELVCPPELAYGTRGAGSAVPPNATLRFEVELLAINPR